MVLSTGWTMRRSNPGNGERLFSKTPRLELRPTQPPTQRVPGLLPTGKAAGAWLSPLTSNTKEWVEQYLYSPNMPSWRCLGHIFIYLYLLQDHSFYVRGVTGLGYTTTHRGEQTRADWSHDGPIKWPHCDMYSNRCNYFWGQSPNNLWCTLNTHQPQQRSAAMCKPLRNFTVTVKKNDTKMAVIWLRVQNGCGDHCGKEANLLSYI
jgi:hypothetical protein